MKERNEKRKSGKAALYVTAAAALALVAAITLTIVFATGANDQAKVPDDGKTSQQPYDSGSQNPGDSGSQNPGGSSGEKPDDSGDQKPDEPASTKIVFALPVEGGTCIKEYTQSSVTFNKTLGIYTGHLGMDFTAEGEAAVVAAYDGTIISVTESVLEGKTVKIDHGNGLVSVYNSLEPSDDAIVGKTVKKGDKIGVISENNRQEYKDGAHLHFEVYEDGVKVSPVKYLEGVEK